MMFGEKVKLLGEQRSLSQRGLADAAGVSVWAIRDYEQGKRCFHLGLKLLVKLARALAISLDVFAECVDEGESAKPRKTTPPAGKGKGEAKAGEVEGQGRQVGDEHQQRLRG